MGTTQFMNAKLASEKPIFTRAKINHIPPHPVLQLLATNKRIVLVLANRSIQRVDQQHEIEHIDLTKFMEGKFKVHSAHLDPSGNHLFVSLKSSDHESLPDVIYIPPKQTQVRILFYYGFQFLHKTVLLTLVPKNQNVPNFPCQKRKLAK